ncbi:MAG: hypothetical protein IT310_12535 [Anaerolineales bacterium]|nr:hypothetical protein [Anaerolineales bacterium]
MQYPKLSFLPLILLSWTLACSGLRPTPSAQARPLAERSYSVKEAMLDLPPATDLHRLKTYLHPTGGFSYQVPAQWKVENSALGVMAYSPNSVVFSAYKVQTGYRLSTASFLNLAANIEEVNYAHQTHYDQLYRREDLPNRSILIEKTLQDQQGVKKIITTIYRQVNQSVYVIEISGDRAEVLANSEYVDLFQKFNDSIQEQAESVDSATYARTWTFSEPDDFSMDIPLGWEAVTDAPAENMTRVQLSSPDRNAIIERIFWDYGQEVRLQFAAQYALKLLREQYAKDQDDLKVTSEVILDVGKKERITWVSRFGGYAGVIYFEIRDQEQILILAQTWNRVFEEMYAPVTDRSLQSFISLEPAP